MISKCSRLRRPLERITVLLCSLALAAGDPTGVIMEAEDHHPSGEQRIVHDPEASGGKAVATSKPGEGLFLGTVPKDAQAYTLWVRHRSGPLVVKSVALDNKQKELKTIPDKPDCWTWTRVGRWPRADLGEKVLIAQAIGNGGEAMVDKVVWTEDE